MANADRDQAAAAPRLLAAHPQAFVADVTRAAEFYRDKLGFRIVYLHGEPPFYGLVARGGASINLRCARPHPVDAAVREREQLLAANIPVVDVARLFAEYSSVGVQFHTALTAQPWGVTDFVARDLDGNLLCFASTVEDGPEARLLRDDPAKQA